MKIIIPVKIQIMEQGMEMVQVPVLILPATKAPERIMAALSPQLLRLKIHHQVREQVRKDIKKTSLGMMPRLVFLHYF